MGQDGGVDSVAVSKKEAAQIGWGASSHSSCERARRSHKGLITDRWMFVPPTWSGVIKFAPCPTTRGAIGTDPTQGAMVLSAISDGRP